jgi:carbon monoxide dehydrogenase subunit G
LVWDYLLDPNRVVGCMPGAVLEEIVGDDTFLGSVKVAVGPITTSYKGRVQFTEKDEANYRIQLTAEGREGSGGTARGTMSSAMRATEDGQTEVSVDVSVDITGRIVQIGRGLMQDVASDMFGQFVSCVKARLESAEPVAEGEAPVAVKPVAIVPLVLRAIWSALVRLARRIVRRPARK